MSPDRDWSVYPVWFIGEDHSEYAKIRARTLGIGQRVDVQRSGRRDWQPARVIDQPAGVDSSGHMVWLRLL